MIFPKWQTHEAADAQVNSVMKNCIRKCPEARAFQEKLLQTCGIRLRDIIDYLVVPEKIIPAQTWKDLGWSYDPDKFLLYNNNGLFPAVIPGNKWGLAFKVEQIDDFVRANHIQTAIEGKPFTPFRRCKIWSTPEVDFWAVQRNGTDNYEPEDIHDEQIRWARVHLQQFRSRRRWFNHTEDGFDHTDHLVETAVKNIGANWACDLFLRAEREYWMSRNHAGRVQKKRQDSMGMGWANQDHHTYDSSRTWFHRNIRILETLGFVCRERFYAGDEAGWGSQILEHPVLGSIIFADIDLAPEELAGDFAHTQLDELPYLRRAGLWTALHGESMLEAGLNHLECMFDHKICHDLLLADNIELMLPFSDFIHLHQELTVGEWWPVDPDRVTELENNGLLTAEQAEDFRLNGAIGSHFENLERNFGFKGFNQPGIDSVLKIIDPRKNLVEQSDEK